MNMRNRNLIIGGVVMVLVALIFLLPRNSSQESLLLHSEDGRLTLDIPADALPSGVTAEDVRIVSASEGDVRAELGLEDAADEEEATMVVYKLSPDGLELNTPVTVTITNPSSENSVIPMLFHVSDGALDLIAETDIDLDLESGQMSISGEISHFSYVGTDWHGGVFNFEHSGGYGEGFIGDVFPFHLAISAGQGDSWFRDSGDPSTAAHNFRIAPDTAWTVHQIQFQARSEGIVDPRSLVGGKMNLLRDGTYTLDGAHTCVGEGETDVFLVPPDDFVRISYLVEKDWGGDGNPESYLYDATTRISIGGGYFTCKELEMMQYLGPQYFIDCGDGRVLTGYYQWDENLNRINDAHGSGLDKDTGMPVSCG